MARVRATLRDVAEKAGVHLSTVSRVLNDKPGFVISDEVAEKIRKVAADLGYKTNPFAYSLRVNRSFTVGVLIPDLTNPVFPPIIRGIEHTLAAAGYTAIIADSDSNMDNARRILERFKARQTDALILATAHRDDDLIESCIAEGYHVVLINREVESDGLSCVVADDAAGVSAAVEHLVGLGHQRIAAVAGPQDISTGFRRHHGFLKAINAAGLEQDPGLIGFCDTFSEAEGRRVMGDLLARDRKFTAVVAGNDLLALGCYDALSDAGLRCPGDISITGFNDMPFADKFCPPLTTIHIPLYEMGQRAAEAVLDDIASPGSKRHKTVLAPSLVVRASTAAP